VEKTLAVSLEQLSAAERDRLRELAVFPEDVDVPMATVELLWGQTANLDDFATEELLQRLFQVSLLLDFDVGTRLVRLHDVIRGYLRYEVGDRGLASLDLAVVSAYRGRSPRGWASGPDDGFFFRYLPSLLAGAGRREELRDLLLDLGWVEAKLA